MPWLGFLGEASTAADGFGVVAAMAEACPVADGESDAGAATFPQFSVNLAVLV